jgi:hypothetical protein
MTSVGRESAFSFRNLSGTSTALVPCLYSIEVPVNYQARWIKTGTVAMAFAAAAATFLGRASGPAHPSASTSLRAIAMLLVVAEWAYQWNDHHA